jgi:hypothetical protein
VIKSLEKKLEIGAITSLQFIETIYDNRYEDYLMQEIANLADNLDDGTDEEDDEITNRMFFK